MIHPLPCHVMAPRDGVRDGGTMGSVKRKQVRGRRARRAAPAPCLPGTRAMGLREVADGVRWPDGHAAPRGAPAPLVPRHVAAGEVEEGRVRSRARRPGWGLGEHGDPRAGAPPTCCRAGSRRTTSSSPCATGRLMMREAVVNDIAGPPAVLGCVRLEAVRHAPALAAAGHACVLSSCFEQISHRNLSMNRTGIGQAMPDSGVAVSVGRV